MLQVQDIYRDNFTSRFRMHFINNRVICDKIKVAYSLQGKKKSEQQLKYMLLEWGSDFKKMFIDETNSHLIDLSKEADNFINAKLIAKKLIH